MANIWEGPYVWTVVEWSPIRSNREPIITVFDNEKAAEAYVNYVKGSYPRRGVCMDRAPVHSGFKVIAPTIDNEEE